MASAKDEAAKLRRLAVAAAKAGKIGAIGAVKQLEGRVKVRIFRRGLDASGGRIGKYSTKPFYLSLAGQKRSTGSQINAGGLTGRGKNDGNPKFANGKPRKSRYYKDGYKGFRSELGFNVGFVDLNLSGNLRSQFTSGTRADGGVLGFTSDEAAQIASGNEKRFNSSIFEVSQLEQAGVSKTIEKAIDKAVKATLEKG